MSLNDLVLSAATLSRLYPTSLVVMDNTRVVHPPMPPEPVFKAKSTDDRPAEPSWKFLGSNEQNLLMLVNYPDAVHLPDTELTFLTNMLAACKRSLGDVAIVNRNNYLNTPYKEILSHFQSRIVFLFGLEPAGLGLPVSFPPFQVQSVAGITYLYTPPLEQIQGDALLKSKLWVCLRSIFGI